MAGLFSSCNEDFKDWADPMTNGPETPVEVAVTAQPAQAYDFNKMEGVEEIELFTPEVKCNVEDAFTLYQVTIHNADKTKSATIPCVVNKATIANVTSAVIKVAGTQSEQRVLPMTIDAYTYVNGAAIHNTVEDVMLTVTIVPVPVPEVWYISGNFIGNGTGSHLAASCVAMFPNPENYEELIFGAKLNPSSTFRIYKQEGKRYPYIAKDKSSDALFTVEDASGVSSAENIMPGLSEGYYKITFNVKSMVITYEAIEGHEAFTAMSMPGSWQSPQWTPADNLMTAETTQAALENHDWSTTVTFAEDCEFKFCANGSWCGNDWGSLQFPLGVANVSDNIKATAGTYKVTFNDLTKNFYFQAVEE